MKCPVSMTKSSLLALFALAACDSPSTNPDAELPDSAVSDAGMLFDASSDVGEGTDASMDASVPPPPPGVPQVSAAGGHIRGTREAGIESFLGIRYGEPPTGEQRFRAPVPHVLDGIVEATDVGVGCPGGSRSSDGDEDCLKLSVWRSEPEEGDALKPVMVFIHGGAFVTGFYGDSTYEGQNLVTRDVILVNIDYRIGLLGWLATDALAEEAGSAGNYGLRDQVLALQWVRDNIRAFGGDPDNVTIFGESSGGMSVCALLATPSAEGLFHRAISQSAVGCHYPSPSEYHQVGDDLAAAAGCPDGDLACLRAAPTSALLDAASTVTGGLMGGPRLRPVSDGILLERRRLDTPDGIDVPLLIGSNLDEGDGFVGQRAGDVSDEASYREYLTSQFEVYFGEPRPELVNDIMALYPVSEGVAEGRRWTAAQDALGRFWTDTAFRCPAIDTAMIHTTAGSPTYLFEFRRPVQVGFGRPIAGHGYELFYVFGNFPSMTPPSPEDLALAAQMQDIWTQFAHRGRIDAVDEFTLSGTNRLVFDESVTMDDAASAIADCDALVATGMPLGS